MCQERDHTIISYKYASINPYKGKKKKGRLAKILMKPAENIDQ
jgi:hypothetical protein